MKDEAVAPSPAAAAAPELHSPGTARVVLLLARLALRRWVNRMGAGLRRRKEGAPGAPRTGTPRKSTGSASWLFLAGVLFFFSGINVSVQFLGRLGEGFAPREDSEGRVAVSLETYEEIIKAHLEWARPNASREAREGLIPILETLFASEMARQGVSQSDRPEQVERMIRLFRESGASRFRSGAPPRGEGLRAVGVVLLALCVCQIWLALGTGNQDLGRVEWSLEWLFTFPAPAGRLFLAKVFEFTLVNPFGWFMIFPFLLATLWSRGMGGWSVPIAVGATLFLGLLLASIRIVAETWLRLRFSLDRLKNLQAFCMLVGTVLWLALLWVALARPTPPFFLTLVPRVPEATLWNPFSLPLLLSSPDVRPWMPAAAMGALGLFFPLAAVGACRFFVRDGLLTSSGTIQGTRHAGPASESLRRPSLFRGVLAKDLRLLVRDRNFLVGTVVVPVLVFAFQVVLYPNLLKGVTGDYRHAATLAFGLGAYILMSSAFHVLSVEGNSLWLLYTFPRELHSILLQKTVVWAGVALVYTGIVLGVTAARSHALDWAALSHALTALVGVVIAAFVAAALGTLATDPLQKDQHRKVRPEIVYLYMLISGLYGYAIYGPPAGTRPLDFVVATWGRLVQITLTAVLVLALWQKVRDRLPYLLDPTETPPPRIALSDGLIAILFFFVFQGLVARFAIGAGIPEGGAVLLVAYAGAGGLVTLFTLYLFWRLKVPRLLEAVGFRSGEGSVAKALALGPIAGLLAAALARGYLRVIDKVEALRLLKEETRRMTGGLHEIGAGWLVGLAVVAAPLFEEYLFRGLVYTGMRRTMRPAVAVLASAGLFAIVHPPLSFVPVFGLGLAAALVFDRTKLLLAPILAHAVYNASMVYFSGVQRPD